MKMNGRMNNLNKGKKTNKTLSYLKKKAKIAMSKYIRKRDSYICITCNKQGNKNNTNAGHFIHNKNSTLFNEINVNCQCIKCNYFLSGNLGVYRKILIEKYGEDNINELELKSNEYKKWSKCELIEIEKRFKLLYNEQKE